MTDLAPKALTSERRAQLIEDALDGIHIGAKARGFHDFAGRLVDATYRVGLEDGADAELEACVTWVREAEGDGTAEELLESRRPPVLTIEGHLRCLLRMVSDRTISADRLVAELTEVIEGLSND